MIVLDEAAYRYAGSTAWALPATTLELRGGEVVGVRGANESGKTTLCLVVSGLAPAALGGELRGRVMVDGMPSASLRPYELAQRCGVLLDNPAVQLTGLHRAVADEVAFGPCNLGLPAAEVNERVRSAMRLLEIEHLAGRDPAHLSGGESQLVALAGLLALRPGHLVLDEPTSRLDPDRAALVAAAVERVAQSGAAVLLAAHDDELLARLCARVVELAPAPAPGAVDAGPARPPVRPSALRGGEVRLDEVTHRFAGGTLGLEAVSLRAAAGESLALTGPTGSGKSTVVRHMNGLLRPTSGRVRLDGEDTRALRVAQLARRVGVAFQEPDRQLFCRTVRAEVAFGAREPGAVDEALELTGLTAVAQRHPYDLAYSRRKLVAIAAVLAMRTPTVVLDEPTTGQDRAGVERLAALVAALRAQGRTLVLVSHDPAFVRRSCDREVRLAGGRVNRP